MKHSIALLLTVVTIIACGTAQGNEFTPEAIEFFEKEVRPLLAAKCFACHGRGEKLEAKLHLTSRAAMLRGGDTGPAIVLAKPEESLLIKAVRYSDELQMPPEGRLTEPEVAVLVRWVERGAPWPDEPEEATSGKPSSDYSVITEEQRQHWSFQPPKANAPPVVRTTDRVQTSVDAFVFAKLEGQNLSPAPAASKATLLRRVTFDLTGLPPTTEELAAFEADSSPDAFARVVDRLLASPHSGEKWARHWLDVARYADSSGKDENHACANAFHYRDYVMQSLNDDKPFDQFIREQIAGDLLSAADEPTRQTQLIATGFLQLGPKALAEQDKPKLLMDIADEQIDAVSKAFLGLTVSCGRCHDHKLEPIPQRDYYALAGIFRSTRTMEDLAFVSKWLELPLADKETLDLVAQQNQQLEQLEKQIKEQSSTPGEALTALQRKRDELKAAIPAIPAAMAVTEGEIGDVAINIRGNHLNLGAKAPRGFLQVVSLPNVEPVPAATSGRLQLANWISRADHPLTARVIVNRVWHWHFGRGLVATVDNLGLTGEAPSHPELLDHLTTRFIAQGWSLKQLHREILLSSTYQMSVARNDTAAQADPENRLRWRFDRRRLTAEELRDALLAVSGEIDLAMGGSLFNYANREPHVTYYKGPVKYEFTRRSLYLPVIRNAMLDLFDLFDHGDALTPLGQRSETTVAPQSLYLLNSEIVLKAAEQVGLQVISASASSSERIARAYQIVHHRPPTDTERAAAEQFIIKAVEGLLKYQTDPAVRERLSWQAFCQSLLISNEFLTVE